MTVNTLLDPAPKSKTAPTPTQSEPRGRRNRLRGPRVALYALLIAGALEALVPILWVLSGSLQSAKQLYKGTDPIPHPFEWGNFATAWNEGGFSQYLPNSLLYTAAAVLGILIIASLAGYALARIEFPDKGAVVGFILVIMIIPMPASFIAQYKLLITLGLANTRIGYILVLIIGGLPISILIMRGFFASQPKELEEAAAIDGASCSAPSGGSSSPRQAGPDRGGRHPGHGGLERVPHGSGAVQRQLTDARTARTHQLRVGRFPATADPARRFSHRGPADRDLLRDRAAPHHQRAFGGRAQVAPHNQSLTRPGNDQ